jgi:DNA-binding GntR family transcriptional regulator
MVPNNIILYTFSRHIFLLDRNTDFLYCSVNFYVYIIVDNMSESIYKKLERAVLTGSLKPRERLIEMGLATQFNVSRFSIRKAIHELARKGFVEIIPNKGARVIDNSDREVEDSFIVRMNLELLAAELIIKKITDEKMAEIKKIQKDYARAVAGGDFDKMILKNEEFHRALYEATENKFLYECLDKVTNAIFPQRYNAYFMLGISQRTVKDHEIIIERIEKKDLEGLKRIIKESIINPNMILKSRGKYRNPVYGKVVPVKNRKLKHLKPGLI